MSTQRIATQPQALISSVLFSRNAAAAHQSRRIPHYATRCSVVFIYRLHTHTCTSKVALSFVMHFFLVVAGCSTYFRCSFSTLPGADSSVSLCFGRQDWAPVTCYPPIPHPLPTIFPRARRSPKCPRCPRTWPPVLPATLVSLTWPGFSSFSYGDRPSRWCPPCCCCCASCRSCRFC